MTRAIKVSHKQLPSLQWCDFTCFMEYLWTTASTSYHPERLFRKFLKIFLTISKKTSFKKSCFKNDGGSRPVNQWLLLKAICWKFSHYSRNSSQSRILRKLLCAWLIQLNVCYLCPKLFFFFWFSLLNSTLQTFFFQKGNHIQRSVKHLRWSVLQKQSTLFRYLKGFSIRHWHQVTCFRFSEMTWRLAEREGWGSKAEALGLRDG